ncbi:MAG: RimK family alpha-L-glutamate ligase [Planctomycetota bacterium]
MKILILSRNTNYYSTQRLVEEAKKKHYQTLVIDQLQCNISINEQPPHFSVSANKRNLSKFDVVIPRIGIIGIDYALLVLQQFESMGIPMLNSTASLSYTKNKFQALQILYKAGIPVPDTVMTHNSQEVPLIIKKLGGLPIILKLFRGSQGKGVILGENISSIQSILTAVWAIGYDILLQKYLNDTKGQDIRILVLGNNIIATMKRIPAKNEFRSNIHQGGLMKKVTVSSEEAQLAIKSAKVLGLNLSGVDIMRTKKGPLVIEVNASPGFEGLEKLTRINIARKIIDYAVDLPRLKRNN